MKLNCYCDYDHYSYTNFISEISRHATYMHLTFDDHIKI